jgi:hypothetical protein
MTWIANHREELVRPVRLTRAEQQALTRERLLAAAERVLARQRASPAFGHDWTHDLTSSTWLQVAFRIPIKCDDDMIGHWQFQTGFKLSAEDLPVRLSATTS